MNYSPILSIFTATFEIAAAIWAFLGRGRKALLRVAATVLLFLAAYQIIETILCSNPEGLRVFGRIAFMVVLWLPPTGLLLLSLLAGSREKWLQIYTAVFYALALCIFIWLLVDRTPIGVSVCLVVFARYYDVIPSALNLVYCGFYQLGLINMLFFSAILAVKTDDAFQRKLIGQILFGSLAFIIPALIVVNLFPIAEGTFSSILCHFALLLAIFIVRLIWLEKRHSSA
jgi:hypothetical protein